MIKCKLIPFERGNHYIVGNIKNKNFLKDLWYLTKRYWRSEEKYRATLLLIAIIVLSLGQVYALVVLNKWYNTFYSSLQEYNNAAIIKGLEEFCIIAACYVAINVYSYYLQKVLQMRWRTWMTREYIKDWLTARTYYLLQVFEKDTDNPDQRISDDIRMFVESTLTLVLGFIKNFVLFVSFVGILWGLSGSLSLGFIGLDISVPGYMVWVTLLYAAIGTWLTDRTGRVLGKLNFDQQMFEADFRYSMIRLRENSENVAFYKGEQFEGRYFTKKFTTLIDNLWKIVRKQKQVIALTATYSQVSVIVPLALSIPKYLTREINLGGLMQVTSAFGRVQDALSFFVDAYVTIAEWSAVVKRLTDFDKHMKTVKEEYKQEQKSFLDGEADSLEVKDLTIKLPDGKVLLEGLTAQFTPASKCLVKGPSGTGKSTLLRTLSGLWPYTEGEISYPKGGKMFLPQRSYLPLGSLRDVLLYPGTIQISDEKMKEVLELCKLGFLAGSLDREEDWSTIFSLGEQQRIAFVRAILYQPKWLFLDEATSAMDESLEADMYNLLSEKLPDAAIISVGHRSTLNHFHDKQLRLLGQGKWEII